MADKGRARIIEHIAVSSVIGFMAVLLAAVAAFVDSAEASEERAAITAISGGSIDGSPARFDDPAFSRVFPLRGASQPYAAVLSLPSDAGAVRAVVLFSRDGEARSPKPIGGKALPEWLAGAADKRSARTPGLARDRSLIACEDAIARASKAAASIGEARR